MATKHLDLFECLHVLEAVEKSVLLSEDEKATIRAELVEALPPSYLCEKAPQFRAILKAKMENKPNVQGTKGTSNGQHGKANNGVVRKGSTPAKGKAKAT